MTVWSQKWWFSHLKAGPNFLSFRWILAFFGGARLGDFLNVACFRLYVIFSKNQRLISNPKKGTFTAVAAPVFIQYGDYEVLVTPYHTYCQDSHPETLGDIYLCLMPVTGTVFASDDSDAWRYALMKSHHVQRFKLTMINLSPEKPP